MSAGRGPKIFSHIISSKPCIINTYVQMINMDHTDDKNGSQASCKSHLHFLHSPLEVFTQAQIPLSCMSLKEFFSEY